MNLDKKIIGENAGIIWHTLQASNKMSWEELLKNTGLKPLELASGKRHRLAGERGQNFHILQ